MAQNCGGWCWSLGLASSLAIGGALASFGDCASAQITPDNTLPDNSSVRTQDNTVLIEGGTRDGTNLFHSFTQFSVPTGNTAHFNNLDIIQNIFSRVTGGSVSNINGVMRANGTANLFLINPNGIVFGPNAQLKVNGSFLASTASSLKFADGTEFSTKAPQNTPLLTVSLPIGLQFGEIAGGIRVQESGLKVEPGHTLALVGSDVTLKGGERAALKEPNPNLASPGGRIELGSVAGAGEVSLNQTGNSWVLGYDQMNTFKDIRLEDKAFVDASGERGGDIQIQGARLDMTQGARIYADTQGAKAGGEILVHTTKAVTLSEVSQITADVLDTATGIGGEVTIKTGQLSIQSGSQVSNSTFGAGRGGNLSITASDSLELLGRSLLDWYPSGLFSRTYSAADAGKLTITTQRLSVSDGAQVSASSYENSTGKAGNLTVGASYIELIGTAANGESSGLFTQTLGTGASGNLRIQTRQLTIRDGAKVTAEASGTGSAGNLNIKADIIRLENQGQLIANTAVGIGGNITLWDLNLLLMRDRSLISAEARNDANGGNITINAKDGFIVAVPSENSDIVANASRGNGGKINITTSGIYGLENRSQQPRDSNRNEINASSDFGTDGTVELNTPDLDPNSGLVNLPSVPVDTEVAQSCTAGETVAKSQFIITGSGGLPPNPGEPLNTDAIQVDLVTLNPNSDHPNSPTVSKTTTAVPERIVEATSWMRNENGEVVLIANAPTTTPHSPWLNQPGCRAS